MTAPRSRPSSATAGVGRTPARTALPPAEATPSCERLLELRAAGARVAPDEDAAPAAPQRSRLAEPLDEIGRQRLADDAANAVRSEVLPRHGAGR